MEQEIFFTEMNSNASTLIIPSTRNSRNFACDYSISNIFFKDSIYCKHDPSKNIDHTYNAYKKVVNDYTFTPVIYITDTLIMAGLTLYIDKRDKEILSETKKKAIEIERMVLKLYHTVNTSCRDKRCNDSIKQDIINNACTPHDVLYIIGVWENDDAFGLDYNWIKNGNVLPIRCETC
jgi:hypothetical protein